MSAHYVHNPITRQ